MLQPKNYPSLLGQAAVLEDRPFITMVQDDNPWAEGLMLTVSVGIAVGVAQLIGGLLTSVSMPSTNALLQVLLHAMREINPDSTFTSAADLRGNWGLLWTGLNVFYGLDGGWLRLLVLVWTPLGLVLQWLVSGILMHLLARSVGGRGALNQTLGATALMVMPMALQMLTLIPFVSVNGALLVVWSTLIVYRALEVAHDLPWRKAAWIALTQAVLLLAALVAGQAMLVTLLSITRGGL